MTNETNNLENIIYLDIETQYLMTDFPGGWKNENNYKNIRIAELGILQNGEYITFDENNIDNLIESLTKENLIVGHNIIQFDYKILKHYFPTEVMSKLRSKTFDTMLNFQKFTPGAGWVSLDDIAQRNFNMAKTEDSIKIPEMWRNGERDKVKSYLHNDLLMTEQFYLKGKEGGNFKYEHKEYGKSFGEREVYVKW